MILNSFIYLQMTDPIRNAEQIYHDANMELLHHWLSHGVFSWTWWICTALTILPWLFWFSVKKSDSTDRLLYSGFSIIILSSYLDMLGMSMGLWGYDCQIVPTIPPYMPWDFTLMPVVSMLFYQYKPNVHPFLKSVVFSAIGSFIVQPLFEWIGIYDPKGWKNYYSFPILIGIYLIGYYFYTRDRFQ